MSTANRSLDDLDRLAFRLARIVRTQFPQFATQGFTLVDLEERLLPFRETRREMADGGTEAWERSLLRILAGERDILSCEQSLRDAAKQALTQASPTLALVRTWSGSLLQLVSGEPLATRAPTTVHAHTSHGCRFCGGRLPDSRRMTYCPHCGLDLTKRQCPACSTELDTGWRFCVTCGRGADTHEIPQIAQKVAS